VEVVVLMLETVIAGITGQADPYLAKFFLIFKRR
jgi:hypothetical protein